MYILIRQSDYRFISYYKHGHIDSCARWRIYLLSCLSACFRDMCDLPESNSLNRIAARGAVRVSTFSSRTNPRAINCVFSRSQNPLVTERPVDSRKTVWYDSKRSTSFLRLARVFPPCGDRDNQLKQQRALGVRAAQRSVMHMQLSIYNAAALALLATAIGSYRPDVVCRRRCRRFHCGRRRPCFSSVISRELRRSARLSRHRFRHESPHFSPLLFVFLNCPVVRCISIDVVLKFPTAILRHYLPLKWRTVLLPDWPPIVFIPLFRLFHGHSRHAHSRYWN